MIKLKTLLRAVVAGCCIAPLAVTVALASDPDEYTLDPVIPATTTTSTGN